MLTLRYDSASKLSCPTRKTLCRLEPKLCLSGYLLKLAKPEAHVHLPEQIAGGVERLCRAFGVAPQPGEASEAPMAVSLERPHAELRREGETFTVVLLGSIEVRRIALRPRLAEKPVGIRFVAALALLLGQLERLDRDRERILGPPGPHMSLPKPHKPEGLIGHQLDGCRSFHRLLEERQTFLGAPHRRPHRA